MLYELDSMILYSFYFSIVFLLEFDVNSKDLLGSKPIDYSLEKGIIKRIYINYKIINLIRC